MRDGVHLATDVYLPADSKKPLAVILERTPYDKRGISRSERTRDNPQAMSRPEVAHFFARHGFAVVMQDVRGRYASEGVFTKYLSEANDGCDTLDWITGQDWSDGRVGTMGLSYGAHTQLAMACLAPPALACMFLDSGGFANAYQGGIRRGGAFELKQATWAYRHALLSPATAADPARLEALQRVDLAHWFKNLPWWLGHSPLAAAPEFERYLFEQWDKSTFDSYWQQVGLYAHGYYQQIPDIPIAIVGSWYDPYAAACVANYLGLADRHQQPTCLLMGPWTHGNRSVTHSGDVDFGPGSTLDGNIDRDYLQYRLAWFRRYLANEAVADTGPKPGVTWFEMGGGSGAYDAEGRLQHGGQWRYTPQWPPADVDSQVYFLNAAGTLVRQKPDQTQDFLEFVFDPRNPVPTVGGAITSGEPLMFGGAFDQKAGTELFSAVADEARQPLAKRTDVLVFQTEPLAQDLVLNGALQADLWVSSDCPDTDITIKLVDVYPPDENHPNGFAMNITDGILRLRYRESWEREVSLEPGRVYPIHIETLPTCNRFKAGHCVRLDISSSNFPQFDINPNNGEYVGTNTEFRVARNRVYCGTDCPSAIVLPISSSEP